ncbi:MAG: cell envelope integrity protein TolA [Rudaea sp.]
MENWSDKLRAYVLALFVHVFCVAVFFAGLLWTTKTRPIELPGPVIEAELVGLSAAPKPQAPRHAQAVKPKTAPPKQPEPVKQPEPKPEPPSQPQQNDRVEREKVAEVAAQAEQAKKVQEERHRQEQVLLQEQQRQERERMQQLQDVKRQREAADRRLKLEKQKLAQLKDLEKQHKTVPAPSQQVPEAEQAKSGSNGADNSLQAQYFAAIQNAVTDNWLRPDSAVQGLHCMLRIVQIPGGDVIGVQMLNPCNADPLTRSSIEQAVKRAAPLPYKGYEAEFRREIDFNFTYDG